MQDCSFTPPPARSSSGLGTQFSPRLLIEAHKRQVTVERSGIEPAEICCKDAMHDAQYADACRRSLSAAPPSDGLPRQRQETVLRDKVAGLPQHHQEACRFRLTLATQQLVGRAKDRVHRIHSWSKLDTDLTGPATHVLERPTRQHHTFI